MWERHRRTDSEDLYSQYRDAMQVRWRIRTLEENVKALDKLLSKIKTTEVNSLDYSRFMTSLLDDRNCTMCFDKTDKFWAYVKHKKPNESIKMHIKQKFSDRKKEMNDQIIELGGTVVSSSSKKSVKHVKDAKESKGNESKEPKSSSTLTAGKMIMNR